MAGDVSQAASERWAGWEPSEQNDGFVNLSGPLWQRFADGIYDYGFEVGDKHLNLAGSVHGGMIATFADYALGHAAWLIRDRQRMVTIQLAINFISSSRTGQVLLCRPELVRKTRSLSFMRGLLTVDGQSIAAAEGIWKVIGA